ncbi:Hypothetical predicted protein, partial [Olea europaea subsp. europaea]
KTPHAPLEPLQLSFTSRQNKARGTIRANQVGSSRCDESKYGHQSPNRGFV